MSDISPAAILYGPNGQPVAWQTGANTTNDASRSMLLMGGLDDSEIARSFLTDTNGQQFVKVKNVQGESFGVGNNGRIRVSPDNYMFSDTFPGAQLDPNIWTPSSLNMGILVEDGSAILNSGAHTGATSYQNMKSMVCPRYYPELSSHMHFRLKAVWTANAIIELGWGRVTAGTAPTDGFFFRINGNGTVSVVMSNNGTETPITSSGSIDVTKAYDFDMEVLGGSVKWQITDASGVLFFKDGGTGSDSAPLFTPATQLKPVFMETDQHMPVFVRIRDTGITSPACMVTVGSAAFSQRDISQNKDWKHSMAASGRGAYQSPLPLATQDQTANHVNSVSPATATLSNTAASYTTLGGRFQFAGRVGAATDYALFVYQVPTGHQLVITGISISTLNIGASVAGSPTVLDWSLGVNGAFVNLSTPGIRPVLRIPLGMQAFRVGDLAGTTAVEINRIFSTPIVCNSLSDAQGNFVHIILQVPVGAATGSQIIRGDVFINGHFD